MPLVQVNEQQIFYALRALEHRPVLLLIHGAGGSHLDWPPQLRRFDSLASCAIDLPGHGRSSMPARSEVSAYADDVLALAKKLRLGQIILVGHSMGGAIALDIALRRPDNVIGLILVSTGARLRVKKELLDMVDSNYIAAVDHIVTTAWGPEASPDQVRRARQLIRSCSPEAMQMDFTACNFFDVMTEVSAIAIPTLVLVGTEDRMTPPKYSQYLADHIVLAELVSIAGAGHMLAMEQPKLVSEAIRDFVFRRLAAP